MVIVRLSGGLGNQMFQYATGFSLARRLNTDLRFDLAWFEKTRLHNGLELPRVFGLTLDQPTFGDLHKILRWGTYPFVYRILAMQCLQALRPRSLIIEPHFHYWPGFEQLADNVYLDGYWQSERYFASVTVLLRRLFRFSHPLDAHNADLMRVIKEQESVSIHVRRGDYSNDPKVRRVHGVDLSRYYQDASAFLKSRVSNPVFYVFSDEPDWVRRHLNIPKPYVIVEHNKGADSYRDMQLMSACRHHIIANSSFSWWGAWLGENPGKIVIAPDQWFRDYPVDTSDLYCDGWIRL